MNWLTVTAIFVLFVQIRAQYGSYDDGGDSGSDDPLRRTLAILKRVVNRMNDNSPSPVDKLRFTDNTDVRKLSELIQQQGKRPGSDKIISEELLQRLMPRVMGQTLPPRTVQTTTPVPTTTTTPATTTTTTTVAPTTTTTSTTTPVPTTTTTTTTTEPPTTTTTKAKKPTTKAPKKQTLTVRMKSLEDFSDDAPQSSEVNADRAALLNDEDARNAKILAEALRILMRDENTKGSKVVEKLKEVVNAASVLSKSTYSKENITDSAETSKEENSSFTITTTDSSPIKLTTTLKVDTTTLKQDFPATTTEAVETTSKGTKVTAIPEAEEEDDAPVEFSFQNTDVSTSTSATSQAQTVYNLNANSNSASDPQISSVFTPVNALVEGISPLILPLLGYSRQALSNFGARARAAPTQTVDQSQKPVQLRSFPSQLTKSNVQQDKQQYRAAAAAPTIVRPQIDQNAPKSLSHASDAELIQAFQNAFKENPTIIQAFAQGQLLQSSKSSSAGASTTSGDAEHQSFGNNASMSKVQLALMKQREAANQQASQGLREVVGTTRSTEPTYYPPQLDRYIGQSANRQEVLPRFSEAARPTVPLPVASGPDPGYNEGLLRVSAFENDSGVMLNEKSTPLAPAPTFQQAPNANEKFSLHPQPSFGSGGTFGGGSGDSGFGGGRHPNASYEEVEKNTLPDHTFFG